MNVVVIDASVAVKWLLPEDGSAEAQQVLDRLRLGAWSARAPDLMVAEVANVLWKRTRSRGAALRRADAAAALAALLESPLILEPARDLCAPALELAYLIPCTVYDALYVRLALREDGLLISADSVLVRACKYNGLGEYVVGLTEAANRLAH
jgi:predicted nucleic acid-binding protein